MSRFYLSRSASADLDAIRRFFESVPARHAAPVLRGLRALLNEIATNPQRGTIHSEATRMLGQPVRSRTLPPYRFFYKENNGVPEVLAILHTARDVSGILSERLQ